MASKGKQFLENRFVDKAKDSINIVDSTTHETGDEKRIRVRSLWIMNIEIFIFALGFSIVLTGVLPYLKQLIPSNTEEEILLKYGISMAANPLGQVIFSPILGYWHNKLKAVRPIGLFSAIVFLIGNLIYSILSLVPSENGRYGLLLLSRFLTGAASGSLAPFLNYINTATFPSERTKYMSIGYGFQCLGMTIGPLIQAALSPLQGSEPSTESYISFDMFTAAGWISLATALISMVFLLPCIFQEFNLASKDQHHPNQAENVDHKKKVDHKPDYFAIWVCVSMFFIFWASFIAIETAGTAISMHQFGWNSEEVLLKYGLIVGGMGISAFVCSFIVGPISRRIDERLLLLVAGISSMILGNLFFMPMPGNENEHICQTDLPERNSSLFRYMEPISQYSLRATGEHDTDIEVEDGCCSLDWCKDQPAMNVVQFVIAFFIVAAGHPFRVSLSQSLFIKVLGPIPQGTWLGILQASGSIARCVAPLLITWLYTDFGTYLAFGLSFIWLGIALFLMMISYSRLIPFSNQYKKDIESTCNESEVTTL